MKALIALALASLPLVEAARDPIPAEEVRLEQYELVLNMESFTDLVAETADLSGQIKSVWSGSLAGVPVAVRFVVLPAEFGLRDPRAVVELLQDNNEQRELGSSLGEGEQLEGAYGWSGYGWFAVEKTGESVERIVIAGDLAKNGYFFELLPRAKTSPGFLGAARDFADNGIRYTGAVLDPEWTEEEVQQRWEEIVPERVKEQGELGVLRTEHYIILTNMRAKGGTVKKFGKLMEERYEEIREIYPFEDLPNGRLLPIYLFQTPAQYHAFLVKVLEMTPQQAERTAGIASRDFYSTSYAAPNDPVHKHEAVHQIFGNILRLRGGGSWFQEGVAEYAEGSKNDRKLFRSVVKSEKNMPLAEFFALRSLIFSQDVDARNGDVAGDSYLQAGCVIEYVAEAKPLKKQFDQFVHRVGALRRNDLEGISAVIQDLYGQTLEEFEDDFEAYWRKR